MKYTQQELYEMSDKTQPYEFFKDFYSVCAYDKEWHIVCIECGRNSKFIKFADKSRCYSCKNKKNKIYNKKNASKRLIKKYIVI